MITASTSRIGAMIGCAANGARDEMPSYRRKGSRPMCAMQATPKLAPTRENFDMWTVNVILPYGIRFIITPHGLLVALVWLAVAFLLLSYVTLLHQSVERGEQLRAEQRRVAMQPGQKTGRNLSFSRATGQP